MDRATLTYELTERAERLLFSNIRRVVRYQAASATEWRLDGPAARERRGRRLVRPTWDVAGLRLPSPLIVNYAEVIDSRRCGSRDRTQRRVRRRGWFL